MSDIQIGVWPHGTGMKWQLQITIGEFRFYSEHAYDTEEEVIKAKEQLEAKMKGEK